MKNISDIIQINSEHSIEFGKAPWNNNVNTIRRRKNHSNGKYDPVSSSEIPIDEGFIDIAMLVCECLKRDFISKSDMALIMTELARSANRSGYSFSII